MRNVIFIQKNLIYWCKLILSKMQQLCRCFFAHACKAGLTHAKLAVMMILKRLMVIGMLGVLLTGCFGKDAENARQAIDEKKFDRAYSILNDALEKTPEDPHLNGLMAELIIAECIENKCFTNDETSLEFDKNLQHAAGTIDLEKKSYNALQNILSTIHQMPDDKDRILMLIKMVDSTQSGGLHNTLIPRTLESISQFVQKGDVESALSLLTKLGNNKNIPTQVTDITNIITGLVREDVSLTTTSMENIRKWREVPRFSDTLMPAFVKTLTHIVGRDVQGTNLIMNGKSIIQLLDVPIFKIQEMSSKISLGYMKLADDPFISAQMSSGVITSDIDPIRASLTKRGLINMTIPDTELTYQKIPPIPVEFSKEDAKKLASLFMIETAISFDINNLQTWQKYLEDMITLSERYQLPEVLLYGIEPERVPSNIVAPYNAYLLGIIKRMVNTNKNAVPFLTRLILNSDNEANLTVQAEEIIQSAMNKAIEKEDYELIYTYGVFNPKVAQISKQKIITSIIDGLEKKWDNDDFDGMLKLSQFLNRNMGIEFNLNNFLLQKFDDFLASTDVKTKLAGSGLQDFLTLKVLEGADLGPKAAFTSERHKAAPAVFNASLKNAVIAAGDGYNVAHTLLKLSPYFYTSDFSEDDQRLYVLNALRAAISTDQSLSALEIALKGEVLRKVFPGMSRSFFLNEALNRLKTPEESQAFWDKLPKDLQEVVTSIRPQFVYMLEALQAFREGERTLASEKIALISNDEYMQHLKPIVNDIRIMVRQNQGTYIMKDLHADIPLLLMVVETIDNPNYNDFSQIQTVQTTLINKIGSLTVRSDKDLTMNSGNVYAYSMTVPYDVDEQSLIISPDAKTTPNLPVKFSELYGDLQSVEFKNGELVITMGNDKSYEMTRLTSKVDVNLLPNGRYGVTEVVSDSIDAIDYSLPKGTIFQFNTDARKRIQEGNSAALYPVEGQILHPASDAPRKISGYYSPDTHTSLINYSYPLQDGGQLFASAKCQILKEAIFCAVNNKFMSRNKYSHIVSGQRARDGSMLPSELLPKRGLLPPSSQ